jgi:hypothetical protein
VVPLAIGGFLLAGRHFRAAGYFAVGCTLTLAACYALSKPLHSAFVLDNVLKGVDNGISFSLAFAKVYEIYLTHYLFVFALTVAIAITQYKSFVAADKRVLFLLYLFGLLTASAFGFALKIGSAIVYVYDSVIVGLIFTGSFYDYAAGQPWGTRVLRTTTALFLALFLLKSGFHHFRTYGMYKLYGLVTGADTRDYANYERVHNQQGVIRFMREELKAHPDRLVFSTIRNVNNHLFDHCALFQYDVAAIAYQRNVFDYRPVRRDVETGRLKYLIVKKGEAPGQLLGADLSGYRLYRSLDGCDVYLNPN